jgi:hypothetical protein
VYREILVWPIGDRHEFRIVVAAGRAPRGNPVCYVARAGRAGAVRGVSSR